MNKKRLLTLMGNKEKTYVPNDISGLSLWLDFSDITKMFTDAGTTAVSSDADKIYQINDKSGNNYHAVQTTEDNRPLYKVNVKNGLSAGLLDGTNDSMVLTSISLTSKSYSMFYSYNNNEGTPGVETSGGYLLDSQTGRFIVSAVDQNAGSSAKLSYYDGSWRYLADFINGWQSNTFLFNTTLSSGTVYRNLINLGSASYTGKDISATTSIFSKYDGSVSFLKGHIGEIIIYNKVLDTNEHIGITKYLLNKWGI